MSAPVRERCARTFGILFGRSAHRGQRDGFMFVDDENVGRGEEVVRVATRQSVRHRRDVPENPAAAAPNAMGRGKRFPKRHFHLENENRLRAAQVVGKHRRRHQIIHAARDDDRVRAGGIDADEGATRGARTARDMPDRDSIAAEVVERRCAKGIVADAGDLMHAPRAGDTRRGHRLIGALAAEMFFVALSQHRLAGLWNGPDARDKIDIDRTEDDDHARHPSLRSAEARIRVHADAAIGAFGPAGDATVRVAPAVDPKRA
jgi:hypothetical protein